MYLRQELGLSGRGDLRTEGGSGSWNRPPNDTDAESLS